ncbi:MAG: hypothetical protein DRI57_24645 [Deltaproteobacteria bacterium]|nr:MAG: hypothetical protein DRI57_24645 [Deltaproteobacteria bacterium]
MKSLHIIGFTEDPESKLFFLPPSHFLLDMTCLFSHIIFKGCSECNCGREPAVSGMKFPHTDFMPDPKLFSGVLISGKGGVTWKRKLET